MTLVLRISESVMFYVNTLEIGQIVMPTMLFVSFAIFYFVAKTAMTLYYATTALQMQNYTCHIFADVMGEGAQQEQPASHFNTLLSQAYVFFLLLLCRFIIKPIPLVYTAIHFSSQITSYFAT